MKASIKMLTDELVIIKECIKFCENDLNIQAKFIERLNDFEKAVKILKTHKDV